MRHKNSSRIRVVAVLPAVVAVVVVEAVEADVVLVSVKLVFVINNNCFPSL